MVKVLFVLSAIVASAFASPEGYGGPGGFGGPVPQELGVGVVGGFSAPGGFDGQGTNGGSGSPAGYGRPRAIGVEQFGSYGYGAEGVFGGRASTHENTPKDAFYHKDGYVTEKLSYRPKPAYYESYGFMTEKPSYRQGGVGGPWEELNKWQMAEIRQEIRKENEKMRLEIMGEIGELKERVEDETAKWEGEKLTLRKELDGLREEFNQLEGEGRRDKSYGFMTEKPSYRQGDFPLGKWGAFTKYQIAEIRQRIRKAKEKMKEEIMGEVGVLKKRVEEETAKWEGEKLAMRKEMDGLREEINQLEGEGRRDKIVVRGGEETWQRKPAYYHSNGYATEKPSNRQGPPKPTYYKGQRGPGAYYAGYGRPAGNGGF